MCHCQGDTFLRKAFKSLPSLLLAVKSQSLKDGGLPSHHSTNFLCVVNSIGQKFLGDQAHLVHFVLVARGDGSLPLLYKTRESFHPLLSGSLHVYSQLGGLGGVGGEMEAEGVADLFASDKEVVHSLQQLTDGPDNLPVTEVERPRAQRLSIRILQSHLVALLLHAELTQLLISIRGMASDEHLVSQFVYLNLDNLELVGCPRSVFREPVRSSGGAHPRNVDISSKQGARHKQSLGFLHKLLSIQQPL
mmetsp:Transcript_46634/g.146204  ORF Transcript_46634/g.146204 Transcript_46634/m.146204 type:complete len:248 (+) Transcript_46634:588-1331(+)